VAELLVPLSVPEIRRLLAVLAWRLAPDPNGSCAGRCGGADTRRALVAVTGDNANDSKKRSCSTTCS
jgi:hypothetical protein